MHTFLALHLAFNVAALLLGWRLAVARGVA